MLKTLFGSVLRCCYCGALFESKPKDGKIPVACESCRRWHR